VPVFLDASTVVAASVDDVQGRERVAVARSTDGGRSWTTFLAASRFDPAASQFTATSPSDWTLLDGEHVYRTADAGAHWTTLTPTRTRLRDVVFASRTEGWVLADVPACGVQIGGCIDQYLYATVDGGRTWALRSPTVGVTANRSP
jgi:photosystem II stability/assembly factor-like uncharacterized protein